MCSCRSALRPTTSTAVIVPARTCSRKRIVALDVKTGKRVWHFQGVHHGVWDYDFPAAPILVDINVNGKPIKALAQVSKQGFTYVLDRRTGVPVWPIEEQPVPQSTVPGERTSPTQPIPDEAACIRAAGCDGERPDRLHAGAEGGGARCGEAIRHWTALHAPLGEGNDRQSRLGRRRQLGRCVVRSGNRHAIRAVDDQSDHRPAREAEPAKPATCSTSEAARGCRRRSMACRC